MHGAVGWANGTFLVCGLVWPVVDTVRALDFGGADQARPNLVIRSSRDHAHTPLLPYALPDAPRWPAGRAWRRSGPHDRAVHRHAMLHIARQRHQQLAGHCGPWTCAGDGDAPHPRALALDSGLEPAAPRRGGLIAGPDP